MNYKISQIANGFLVMQDDYDAGWGAEPLTNAFTTWEDTMSFLTNNPLTPKKATTNEA